MSPEPLDRALVVDDHAIVRDGLAALLRLEGNFAEVELAPTGKAGLAAATRRPFGVVLLDISLPDLDGIQVLQRIRALERPSPVLVLSMHLEESYALRALRAGAGAFLNKSAPAEEILAAVRAVQQGRRRVTPDQAEMLAERLGTPGSHRQELTDREAEILRHIVQGRGPSEIARLLGISPKTVGAHREHIQHKFGASGTAELVRLGIDLGLLG